MVNERWTEQYTLEELKVKIGENDTTIVEAQTSYDKKVKNILKQCGGKPKFCEIDEIPEVSKGIGKPEFIIRYKDRDDLIVIIECKNDRKKHETEEKNKPKTYSVDGVLYYAKFFCKKYNVIAIAVSGEEEDDIKVSTYLWYKNANLPEDKNINTLLNINEYCKLYDGEQIKKDFSITDIRRISLEFHNELRELGFTEKEKPLFIACILIALSDNGYRKSYKSFPDTKSLIRYTKQVIIEKLKDSDIPRNKVDIVSRNFDVITRNQKLNSIRLHESNSILHFIETTHNSIYPMMCKSQGIDIVGEFYNEFIKYTGGDGNGLGIVLTPKHITELFTELAEINKTSKVLDICCGTGAFLVSAMKKMLSDEHTKEEDLEIKESLYGIEINTDLYTMACANMIVRGDGKSHLFNEDCLNKSLDKKLKNICNIGLINPPYSQKTPEIKFIERMLDLLVVGGIGIAIVPMSVAIGTKYKTERMDIMSKHRLLAVMSMPDDLFYPVGVNTCIMVWKAHEKHNKDKHKTWFGYWKEDGFTKRKKIGRVDHKNEWKDIKDEWLRMYYNKEVIDGKSAYEYVDFNDEWLVEAYMKTDYSKLNESDFEKTVREYYAYLVKSGDIND
ncbi:HsdM family class I SAM-dependent methyltransferase [Clostridium perfringens]|uniref:HsdM family class I SAM-dependent methyltransferase n=1 Tax=Clostridium perfringens TaxID=1502 RepID=UPI00096A2F0A|nr:N-6 DNA methylase [Clostridium perfringens]MBI6110134.1 N-6 DNA methylase [Clostridium perfringens]MBI6113891.1 N-6 DNA methylase [Clostridium perfringens]MDU3642359.1 N-6 DNA methylase [Clostridium perfringens]MDU7725951.1 N-6 DNA methylase [Clostridium perfringens]